MSKAHFAIDGLYISVMLGLYGCCTVLVQHSSSMHLHTLTGSLELL